MNDLNQLKLDLNIAFQDHPCQINITGGMSQLRLLQLINDKFINIKKLCKPANKSFILKIINDDHHHFDFKSELKIMKDLENITDFTVKLIAWNDLPCNYLITEKFDHDLNDLLYKEKISLSLLHKSNMIENILSALAACEKLKIIHNDLKPGNILVNKIIETNGNISFTCYLNDFGNARYIDKPLNEHENDVISVAYTSPERLENLVGLSKSPITSSSDVFSFGLIVYEIIFRIRFIKIHELLDPKTIYQNFKTITKFQGNPTLIHELSAENQKLFNLLYENIYKPCVHLNPSARPLFSQLLKSLTDI